LATGSDQEVDTVPTADCTGVSMNLIETDLPANIVTTLRKSNIREVESLLSLTATPQGLIAISRVLKMSVEAVQEMSAKLRSQYPDLEVSPASTVHPYAMGHSASSRKSE
jgi:hypothetical protein